VTSNQRPVPLYPLFLHPDDRIGLLLGRRGFQGHVLDYLRDKTRSSGRGGRFFPRLEDVLEGLRGLDLLPAMFFLKSRADCDRAVDSFDALPRSPSQQEEAWETLEPLILEFPILRGHRQFKNILRHGVASHHAGHLPQWKLLVERLMNQGCLDAIFSTSTVAAGMDFPARTVVLLQSDRFNGRDFEPLTATELQQMTGRAGRRGKDRVGFALFLPGPHQDLPEAARLLRSGPDSIRSQIRINSSMVLNLLLSHRPAEIRQLLERSLAATQPGSAGETSRAEKGGGGNRGGRGREGNQGRRGSGRGRKSGGSAQSPALLLQRLTRGRVFLDRDGSLHVAFRMGERRGKPLCMAHRLDRPLKVRKGRVVVRSVPVVQIQALLDKRLDLPPEDEISEVRRVLDGLDLSSLSGEDARGLPSAWGGDGSCAPHRLRHAQGAAGSQWLWQDFLDHLWFLQETGFVDEQERLTADGRWASQLRLDQPILVAEAIRRGAFDGRATPVLAGLVAPFVTDRDREVFVRGHDLTEMANAFDGLVASIHAMSARLEQAGFPTPVLQFWPAAALNLWARGLAWTELRAAVVMDEGDLVSLIVRTADHLRQVCALEETHPALARTARLALRRIQREPAVYL
jgi:superfamily II RNA helicase